MLNKNLLLILFLFIALNLPAQTILSYVDSTQVNGAQIWGGISWNGSAINITTMMSTQIHLRKFDTNLNDLSTDVQLTSSSDYQGTNIADHKHVYLNGYLYVTFMTGGNQELYLLKTDSAGNRMKITTLETLNNNSYLTNDMHLVTDSNFLYVIYPKITGGLATEKRVRKYNLDLDSIDTYEAVSPIAVANLGNVFYKDSSFYMFTGNETQNDLIVSHWNKNWTAQTNFDDTLIKSVNGEWHYFSTGIAYDTANSLWYIAYHIMLPNSQPDHETLWLAVFDSNFNLLENQQFATPAHFRPHLLLHNGYLYVVYDGTGVTIKKYKVDASSISKITNLSNLNDLKVFPNPFVNKLHIACDNNFTFPVQAKLYNQMGEYLGNFNCNKTEQELDLSYLPIGFYYFTIKNKNCISAIKLIKTSN